MSYDISIYRIETKENNKMKTFTTLFFKANGFNMREQRSWKWTETHVYEFKENELLLLKKEVSPREVATF